MSSCPLCETPNADDAVECVTCGKALVLMAQLDVDAGGLPEIELGRLVGGEAIPAAVGGLPELERGRASAVGAVAADVTPDLEVTARAPVGNVVAEGVPEMEQTQLAARESTPASVGPVVCRACQTPQQDPDSIFCARCGWRLPVLRAAPAVVAKRAGDDELVRCLACGSRVRPEEHCSNCGVPLRAAG